MAPRQVTGLWLVTMSGLSAFGTRVDRTTRAEGDTETQARSHARGTFSKLYSQYTITEVRRIGACTSGATTKPRPGRRTRHKS